MDVVSVENALLLWREVLQFHKQNIIRIPVEEAQHYVVAEPIYAPVDIPAFNKSAMDGYALSYEEGQCEYVIDGIIGAGVVWDKPISKGHAVRIMTGAPVPIDCDTVVMQEQVQTDGTIGSTLVIYGQVKSGGNIIYRGEECRAGTIVVPKGIIINTEVQTVLGGLGYTDIPVYAMPKVLLLTSGREIIEPGLPLQDGQVYNSNRIMLSGLLHDAGFFNITQYHVNDDPRRLSDEIQVVMDLATDADIIISSGGVSVGLFDTMPLIFEKLGANPLYKRILMRPGAASYGAVTDNGKLIFGLSGNPGAAYNGFHLVVKPTLMYYKGVTDYAPPIISCTVAHTICKHNPFDRYIQGRIVFNHSTPVFEASKQFNSSHMIGLAGVTALAKIPQGVHEVNEGHNIEVLLL